VNASSSSSTTRMSPEDLEGNLWWNIDCYICI
jgi:hypothetical protein